MTSYASGWEVSRRDCISLVSPPNHFLLFLPGSFLLRQEGRGSNLLGRSALGDAIAHDGMSKNRGVHMIPTVEDAIILACQGHRGQVDKGGNIYVLHPLALVLEMDTDAERRVAALHDFLEDCAGASAALLREQGYPEEEIVAIERLTRKEGERWRTYLKRIKPCPLARKVKRADLRHNSQLRRLHRRLSSADYARRRKYQRALAFLEE
jgi:hypothetical protein